MCGRPFCLVFTMKNYHYRPEFNSRVYGPAEKRADEYWKKRKKVIERGDDLRQTNKYDFVKNT